MLRQLLIALVVLSFVVPTLAEDSKPAPRPYKEDPRVMDAVAAWETWIEYQLGIERIPAASVGIVHDQELLTARGFGFANPDSGSPATADTIYSICSISKLFTSVALMQLSDANRVQLDAPYLRLPGLVHPSGCPPQR